MTYLEHRYADGSSPALLDVVDVPLLRAFPHAHQTENHLIDSSIGWKKIGRCSVSRLAALLECPATLWGNAGHTVSGIFNCMDWKEASVERNSLFLVSGAGLSVCVKPGRAGQKCFYGEFQHGGQLYKLSITDRAVRDHFGTFPCGKYAFPATSGLFLCISLTEPYEADGRCHKLIAAVISEHPLAPS